MQALKPTTKTAYTIVSLFNLPKMQKNTRLKIFKKTVQLTILNFLQGLFFWSITVSLSIVFSSQESIADRVQWLLPTTLVLVCFLMASISYVLTPSLPKNLAPKSRLAKLALAALEATNINICSVTIQASAIYLLFAFINPDIFAQAINSSLSCLFVATLGYGLKAKQIIEAQTFAQT